MCKVNCTSCLVLHKTQVWRLDMPGGAFLHMCLGSHCCWVTSWSSPHLWNQCSPGYSGWVTQIVGELFERFWHNSSPPIWPTKRSPVWSSGGGGAVVFQHHQSHHSYFFPKLISLVIFWQLFFIWVTYETIWQFRYHLTLVSHSWESCHTWNHSWTKREHTTGHQPPTLPHQPWNTMDDKVPFCHCKLKKSPKPIK